MISGATYFPQFHRHSDHSIKDGASSIEQYVDRAAELGGRSVALTDHGQLGGAARLYFACRAKKLKPIYGIEAYVNEHRGKLDLAKEKLATAKKRAKANVAGAKDAVASIAGQIQNHLRPSRHVVLLARNREGYRNLCKVATDAWLNGFYYAPRTDSEFLARHAGGLIYSTACIGGAIPALARRDFPAAVEEAKRIQAIFGPENFVVELMVTAYPKQREANETMLRLAAEVGAKTIVTCDVHYSKPEDALAQSALLLMRDGKTIDDRGGEGAWQFDAKDLFDKTLEQVIQTWQEHHKDYWPAEDFRAAIRNTYALEDSIEGWDFDESLKLPGVFENPVGRLRELVQTGLRDRKSRGHLPAPGHTTSEYVERLRRELGVIEAKGFSEYLLMLWDLCKFARESGARLGPGRGSAGASLATFVLGITEIDPIRFNLIFERFLDPTRKDAPDVDLDFSPEHRDGIKTYLEKKYPVVATIGTYATFKTKSTIQAVARVYKLDHREVAEITKPLGDVSPTDLDKMSFDEVLDHWPTVRKLADANPEAWEVIKTLDGLVSHRGTHASGVLIAPASAKDELPMIRDPKTGAISTAFADTAVQGAGTSYEGREISRLGLIKIDVLGQNTLNVAAGAVELIARDTGEAIDLRSIELDDPKALAIASTGDVPGVFQFDTPTSRPLLRHVGVDAFEDLAAITALARPGPLKNKLHERFARLKKQGDAWKAEVPEAIWEDLGPSRGLMVYQEDVMRTLTNLAGFDMSEANAVRKILSKKLDEALLVPHRQKFVEGGVARGHDRGQLEVVFDSLNAYCSYAFAKPHAVAYAREAYDQLWVLAHYPLYYFASLLRTTERKKKGARGEDVLVGQLRATMAHKIRVLGPSVNGSGVEFDVEGEAIRYGLGKVKGVGAAADELVAVRGESPFETFEDFVRRATEPLEGRPSGVNAKARRLLIVAGALDELDLEGTSVHGDGEVVAEFLADTDEPLARRNALLVRDAALTWKHKRKVFEAPETFVPSVLAKLELELLGVQFSLWGDYERLARIREAERLLTVRDELERGGSRLAVLAEVVRFREVVTRGNQRMAFLALADETGTIENVSIPPYRWKELSSKLRQGKVVVVRLEREESRNPRYGKWSYRPDDRSTSTPVELLAAVERRLAASV